MVAGSLGLTEPWYISGVEFDPDMKQLAIDETSRLRGHDYVTIIIDAAQRRVIDVEQGRDS